MRRSKLPDNRHHRTATAEDLPVALDSTPYANNTAAAAVKPALYHICQRIKSSTCRALPEYSRHRLAALHGICDFHTAR